MFDHSSDGSCAERTIWLHKTTISASCARLFTTHGMRVGIAARSPDKPVLETLENEPDANGAKGTIIFTNASAALKGFPMSGAFAMACHAKSGLAHSMARELMPEGIHIANVPIDAAIGWTQEDGTRAHRLAGTAVDDNMADPDRIAETYLQLHRQHRSTWAFEVVLRQWAEKW
jgi:NAD(P)-dependent dehydrogenase (short-subunit alcohol dehydrogenase family)